MSLSGPRKAAMLLMSLDPPTAAELLRSAEPDILTDVAAELAYLTEVEGKQGLASVEPIREFFGLLYGREAKTSEGKFVQDMLNIILGEQKSQEVLLEVNERVKALDPFRQIRSAEVPGIARALAGESPQVVSVVLTELPAGKSAELVGLLDEDVRSRAVQCMTIGQEVSSEAKLRIATVVQSRLEEAAQAAKAAQADQAAQSRGPEVAEVPDRRRQQMRKVAVLLRGLDVELRDGLVKSLSEQDSEAAESVQDMMVIWEDVALVADRPLQEAMRSVDSRKLALALVDADERTAAKIRQNISERAKAMLEEEASLLSEPKPAEIEQAREDILKAMRELNASGELKFEEG